MSRPQSVTDEQILAAVHHAVVRDGTAFSLAELAKSLGVSPPVFFQRFGTRSNLVVRALAPHTRPQAVLALLDAGPSNAPLDVQLHELASALEAFFTAATPCLMALKELGLLDEDAKDRAGPKTVVRALARWLVRAGEQQGLDVEAPESLALTFIGAFQTRAFIQHLGVRLSESASRHRDQVVMLIALALRSPRAG